MPNPFAASKSGMGSLLESMLPPDVMDAIKVAKEQLPIVVQNVQSAVVRIEGTINEVNAKVTLLHDKVDRIRLDFDLTAVPETLPSQIAEMEHGIPNGALNGVVIVPDNKEDKLT